MIDIHTQKQSPLRRQPSGLYIQQNPTSKLEVNRMTNSYRQNTENANKTEGGAGQPASKPCPYLAPSLIEADKGEIIGISPTRILRRDILALGHPTSPIKAIRAKCIDCCGGSEGEARKCTATGCPLWPLRMGRNVYHASARPKS